MDWLNCHHLLYFRTVARLGSVTQAAAYGPPPIQQMTRDFLTSQQVPIKFSAGNFKIQPLVESAAHDLPKPWPTWRAARTFWWVRR